MMIAKLINKTLKLLLVSILLGACEEKVVDQIEDASTLYFYRNMYTANNMGIIQYDSIDYSFFLAGSIQETEIWLQVNLTGNISTEEREFSIVQTNVNEVGAAVAGTHYIAFDDERMKPYMSLPANATSTMIPIILTRTGTMDDNSFKLALAIEPNENFVEGIKEGNIGSQSFIINVTAEVMQPVTWDRNYDYTFGTWGEEKMKFLIDHVGFSDFEIDMSNLEARYYWNLKAKTALAEYEAEYGPLYEADNITRVTFP